MRTVSRLSLLFILIFFPIPLFAQPKILLEWKFDSLEAFKGWSTNHIGAKVENGVLKIEMNGRDPFLVTPPLQFDAGRWQVVEAKIKTDSGGNGELYFTNTNEGQYGGFDGKKQISWQPIPDENWHEYRLFPFWEAQKKIIKFRLDFPNLPEDLVKKRKAEVQWIRVVDLGPAADSPVRPDWDMKKSDNGFSVSGGASMKQTPEGLEITQSEKGGGFIMSPLFLSSDDDSGSIVSIEMDSPGSKDSKRVKGTVRFVSNQGGFVDVPFILDDVPVYNIDLSQNKDWTGEVRMIGFRVSDQPGAKALVKRIAIGEEPQGPAFIQLDKESLGLLNASNRAGQELPFGIRGSNIGGKPVRLSVDFKFPKGLAVDQDSKSNEVFEVEPGGKFKKIVHFRADKALDGDLSLRLVDTQSGKVYATASKNLKIEASLNLPKANYVPEPKPVKSQYDIGALYYPGWEYRRAWDRIEPVAPIRKPMLGWYDEANVECIDWQIKWAVENGIDTMYVDWYWRKGYRHHEHWINGFKKARYRKYLKYAIMWANHNGPEAHSYEDQEAVTEFWCKNLFNDSQYEYIDGKPVVWIWSAREMDEGIAQIEKKNGNTLKKGEGVKRLLDISRKIAVKNGFKGIYFIVMKFPERGTSPEDVQWYADAGFDMTSIYHFMESGGKAKDPHYFDFQLVADASLPWWTARYKTGILPFMPNLSSGWDDRPWNNRTVIYNRTPELFRKILEDYKTFAAETGIKKVVLAPVNEWGEGSYIEPNREFGFSMYEQVREVLCEKPAEGWPLNFAPVDVGLGPYDLPEQVAEMRTSWDFESGEQGWKPLMGVTAPKVVDKRLTFDSNKRDPAIMTTLNRVSAKNYSKVVVRMKISPAPKPGEFAQLFWSGAGRPIREATSEKAALKQDSEFHDYVFPIANNKFWKGYIAEFRFDPINAAEKKIEIDFIRMEK